MSPPQKAHLTAEGALVQTPALNAKVSITLMPILSEFFPGTIVS